eukprot:CAMPEP_0197182132 /NCGR_PEP_ID=MMETSP1423-20130617/6196_1 /TAXON_ID=476441 /ORGANISM="Pseudo-nitzschia heimii, Strain UNC1101" /LENGTH=360 /DNA_ID=CAMNT_0042632507 /DNA_START=77 /DNA_END=1155 /DNA_ORIENTATION=-
MWAAIVAIHFVDSLTIRSTFEVGFQHSERVNKSVMFEQPHCDRNESPIENGDNVHGVVSRRQLATKSAALVSGSFLTSAFGFPKLSGAEVGSLPEFSDTNAIFNGLTVNVADASQQQSMIDFLIGAFNFEVQRQRIQGSVEETWLGYGPEQLSVPSDFELPVSSFSKYGGHASINVRYDSKSTAPLYRQGDEAPGNSIAYLQLGVTGYRISQMLANGGNILDAYGLVNVISPAGLPIRGVVGIAPDPMMYVAINCQDVKESKEFYERLGFVEQEVPYSRPSKGTTMFDPAPPKGSYYMSPSPNCMGVLLLQGKKKKTITPNPVIDSLNIVYKPSSENEAGDALILKDPSGIPIKFQSTDA